MCYGQVRDSEGKRQTSTPEGDISDDEQQHKYKDLEQEVKDAEPKKSKESTTEEATGTKAEAKVQKAEAKEAEARAASAASAAAADGQSIKKNDAAASAGTVASEVQETKGKDEKILALIQERKSTAKNEKEKIKEISKEIKRCIRDNKRSKRREKCEKILEEVKGTRNISSVTSVKKRILITKVKNKEGEAVKTRQGIANVFEKFNEDLYEGEEGYTEEGMDSRTEDDNRSQSTQLHSRVYKK